MLLNKPVTIRPLSNNGAKPGKMSRADKPIKNQNTSVRLYTLYFLSRRGQSSLQRWIRNVKTEVNVARWIVAARPWLQMPRPLQYLYQKGTGVKRGFARILVRTCHVLILVSNCAPAKRKKTAQNEIKWDIAKNKKARKHSVLQALR